MKPDADTLTAYALGLLDGEELRAVEAYLHAHPEVAAQVRADQEALAAFALSLEPAEVPAGSEERLLARIRREEQAPNTPLPAVLSAAPMERELPASPAAPAPPDTVQTVPPARKRALWPLAFAAAAAVAVVLLWPNWQGWQTQQALRGYQNQPGAVTTQLQGEGGQRLGTLVRLADGRTFAVLNEAPQRGRVYQAWSVANGQAQSIGVFQGRHILTPPLPRGAAFAVSVEPPGGSEQPTTTPILVQQL